MRPRHISRTCEVRGVFLLVLGTSLRVDGAKQLATSFAKAVCDADGTVYVDLSRSCSWSKKVDYRVCRPCDEWVQNLKKSIPGFHDGSAEDPVVVD